MAVITKSVNASQACKIAALLDQDIATLKSVTVTAAPGGARVTARHLGAWDRLWRRIGRR